MLGPARLGCCSSGCPDRESAGRRGARPSRCPRTPWCRPRRRRRSRRCGRRAPSSSAGTTSRCRWCRSRSAAGRSRLARAARAGPRRRGHPARRSSRPRWWSWSRTSERGSSSPPASACSMPGQRCSCRRCRCWWCCRRPARRRRRAEGTRSTAAPARCRRGRCRSGWATSGGRPRSCRVTGPTRHRRRSRSACRPGRCRRSRRGHRQAATRGSRSAARRPARSTGRSGRASRRPVAARPWWLPSPARSRVETAPSARRAGPAVLPPGSSSRRRPSPLRRPASERYPIRRRRQR